MILYHGTNCEIRKPDPRKGHRGTDFGQGFYLTPDMESARNMASLVVAREGTGCRTINVFELDDTAARLAGLKVRKFEGMDENWIRFVIANRNFEWDASDHNLDQLYDVVVGFESHYQEVPDFTNCALTRTTSYGCGFDFKLVRPECDFLAVEVKGLRAKTGQIQLTEKEFRMAEYLNRRFYLYVVTNFAQTPKPCVIEDPVNSGITFEPKSVESKSKVWVAQIVV